MDLNDVPATGNRWLMRDVLRRDWKFSGFVVSDANAVNDLKTHGFARDPQDCRVKALSAGVNMEMSFNAAVYLKNLLMRSSKIRFPLKRSMTWCARCLKLKSNLVCLRILM